MTSTSAWHQRCTLRADVRNNTLTLAEFAADLNDVRTGAAPLVYRDPTMFFDRTYPTYRMKGLTRDVLRRLAGQGDRPVLRLQVAYGGGKTHSLITLLHLAEQGHNLAHHPTVAEFRDFAGLSTLPAARVALLPGDKHDIHEGLEVFAPDGRSRRVSTLWGALAYQVAGDAGYARVKDHDEGFTTPAEPILVDLLRESTRQGGGVLILIDEALWYYRTLVNDNPRRLGIIQDFYQVLTQAVSKVEQAVLVASLLDSRGMEDATAKECMTALDAVFERLAEAVEPVAREDVAEVLRRRLFEHVPAPVERRPVIDAVMATLQHLPVRDSQRSQDAYDQLTASYPFSPELIGVLYGKWTQVPGFQRTRGALRLLAYALRDSEGRDPNALIGPSTLLPSTTADSRSTVGGLSAALNELVQILSNEGGNWTPILDSELSKARDVQATLPTLRAREVEQAVIATFLHSHPFGQKGVASDLWALIADPNMDRAALEEGLRKWRDQSWYLNEDPLSWQLGTTPNLTQVHYEAMRRLTEADITDEMIRRIREQRTLFAADNDVKVSALPEAPRAVDDDMVLQYLVLGPTCAVALDKPLPPQVEAFFREKSGPNDPRTNANNIVALVPEMSRISGLREQIRKWLGWKRVKDSQETQAKLTDEQRRLLPRRLEEAANGLPEAVLAAYNILVVLDEGGAIRSQTLRADSTISNTPFERVKAILASEDRLLLTTLDPELLLPDGPFEIWPANLPARRAKDLIEAFGRFPRLPRLLQPAVFYETLKRGVREGSLVLQLMRPDGSALMWWRIAPNDETLQRPDLEVLPAISTTLTTLPLELLRPNSAESLWPSPTAPVTLATLQAHFDGKAAPRLSTPEVLFEGVRSLVQRGDAMALLGPQAFYREPLPVGPLAPELELRPPPAPLQALDLTPQALPDAWRDGRTTTEAISQALATRRDYPIPLTLLTAACQEALRLGLFEQVPDGDPLTGPTAMPASAQFRLKERIRLTPETLAAAFQYGQSTTQSLRTIRERAEQLLGGQAINDNLFAQVMQEAIDQGLLEIEGPSTTLSPATRVRRPNAALYAEAFLDPLALSRLGEEISTLMAAAGGLQLTFKIQLTAEGQPPSDEVLQHINDILNAIRPGWQLR
jgi:hypothetical protein